MLGSAILHARHVEAAGGLTLSHHDLMGDLIELVDPLSLSSQEGLAVADDNPRSTQEVLAASLSAAQHELSLVSMHLKPEFLKGVRRQLKQLLASDEWDEGDEHLNPRSFRSFARAMAALRPTTRPMLGLSSRGNILAMWGSGDHRLSFEHFDRDELTWFIHARDPEGPDSAAGKTTVALIPRIIDAHRMDQLLYGRG